LQKQDKTINTSLNNVNAFITSNTTRINKIEARETNLYKLFSERYTTTGIAYYMNKFISEQ